MGSAPTAPDGDSPAFALVRACVEPPGGIEPPTPSLPWNHQEPLCGTPYSQVTPDRRGRSYRFSFGQVMRSLPSHVLIVLSKPSSAVSTIALATPLSYHSQRNSSRAVQRLWGSGVVAQRHDQVNDPASTLGSLPLAVLGGLDSSPPRLMVDRRIPLWPTRGRVGPRRRREGVCRRGGHR